MNDLHFYNFSSIFFWRHFYCVWLRIVKWVPTLPVVKSGWKWLTKNGMKGTLIDSLIKLVYQLCWSHSSISPHQQRLPFLNDQRQSTKHLLLLNRPDRVTLAIHNVWRKPKHWNILQLSLQSRTIYIFSKQNWNWKENSYGKYTESIINLKKVQ